MPDGSFRRSFTCCRASRPIACAWPAPNSDLGAGYARAWLAEEARRQSLLVASESDFDDMMDFIERNEPEPDDVHGRDADASR